ncbi:MAG: metal-dependent transcriptional regulator [Pseudomonadota bacterium]|jgi:DtxR family Mn-dependent transcriptional regulator
MDIWKKFEENNITHSAAHHLVAILELREKRGYARVTDVAKELNITTGSASINLKALKSKNLIVEDENKFLSLSDEGEAIARAVMGRKQILLDFLVNILKVSPEQAEIDSCKTEHLISAETAKKLEEFAAQYQRGAK